MFMVSQFPGIKFSFKAWQGPDSEGCIENLLKLKCEGCFIASIERVQS